MDEKYTTKAIFRSSVPMIKELQKAFSKKLGFSITQAATISLAIENQYKIVCKKWKNRETQTNDPDMS